MSSEKITVDWRELMPAIVVFVLAVTFLLWAQIYEGRERLVPTLVAWLTIGLATLDILSCSGTRFGQFMGKVLSGAASTDTDKVPKLGGVLRRQVIAVVWMSGFVALVAVVGFLPVIPIYVLLFMRLQGGKPWRQSVIAAVATSLFVWVAFELLLRYNVYGGLLFEG